VENPGVTTGSPASSIADVGNPFVTDVFYEAGDSWTPSSAPHKPTADTRTPKSKDKGSFESIFVTLFLAHYSKVFNGHTM